jgi:UTP--glucose-1-phosphate uridylyltransferase
MEDLATQIRNKMGAAGLSAAAIDAFLFQYRKLELNEAGLIPEDSISPVSGLPSIDDEPVPNAPSDLATRTVVLKLNGGLGTGMGLEKAKSLLKVRDKLSSCTCAQQSLPSSGCFS